MEGLLLILYISASLSFLMKVIGGVFGIGVLLKDGFLILLIFLAFLSVIKRRSVRIIDRSIDSLVVIFMLFCFAYTIKSPLPLGVTFKLSWALLYGPILYLSLNQIEFVNINIPRVSRLIFYWLMFLVITGVLIYLSGQETFFRRIGLYNFILQGSDDNFTDLTNFFRLSKEGIWYARMSGLLVSNLEMAFILIVAFGMILLQIKERITRYLLFSICGVALYLTTNRSAIVAIVFSVLFLKLQKQRISVRVAVITVSLILTPFAIANYGLFLLKSGKLDSSSAAHFIDLFIRGPQLVLENWKGAGVGMATGRVATENTVGNIESYYYMLSIELGIAGLLIYLLLIFTVLRRFLQRGAIKTNVSIFDNEYLIIFLIVLSLHVGGIFLPVLNSRLLTSLIWTLIYFGINLPRYKTKYLIETPAQIMHQLPVA